MVDPALITGAVIGRTLDLFESDLAAREPEARAALRGRRILVVGGAGSIGSVTTGLLLGYRPAVLDVVDQDENGLAEVMRDIRASGLGDQADELRALPLDMGSATMMRLLFESPAYDLVLNFAALKHVRSEKDSFSLLQMLDTNLVKGARLLQTLERTSPKGRYFAVSTDKAANPSSVMGASKRLMEGLMFQQDGARHARLVTSARFANVAFSQGSLLDSVLRRVSKRQLVAVPEDTRRYFISATEAARISLLAAIAAPDRHLLVPSLDSAEHLQDLRTVVHRVLRELGVQAREYRDADEARRNLDGDLGRGQYPVLLTPLDTEGEKPFEEFLGAGESAVEIGLASVRAVRHVPGPPGSLETLMSRLEAAVAQPETEVTKVQIIDWIGEAVPQFAHRSTGLSLDDRV